MKVAGALLLLFATSATSVAAQIKPFEFVQDKRPSQSITVGPECGFTGLELPSNYLVLAAGAYSGRKIGFQIDQSGHEGTQIDVAVNSKKNPVVLILGAYEPTIWNIGWSKGTEILAVYVSGNHRQVIAGLSKEVPILNSTHENSGPCGYFYIQSHQVESVDPYASQVFGRPVDMLNVAMNGKVVVGQPLAFGTALVTSSATPPASYYDKDAPVAGPAGLEDAVQKGLLRKATAADVKAWTEAVEQNSRRPEPPLPNNVKVIRLPQGEPRTYRDYLRAYVVLKPFTFPAGLYGANSATFYVPPGVPVPTGNSGHSTVRDFNSLQCPGTGCGAH